MPDRVDRQLDQARQSLLDLSLNNRLLNFRPTQRTTIPIIDEVPEHVWELLIEQRKMLEFLAWEEHEMVDEDGNELPPADAEDIAAQPSMPGEKPEDYEPDITDAGDPGVDAGADGNAPATIADDSPASAQPPRSNSDALDVEDEANAADAVDADARANAGDLGDSVADDAEAANPDDAEPAAAPMFHLPSLDDLPAAGEHLPDRYRDRHLQTRLEGDDLQTNLLRIQQTAASALDERGVNLLFLAIGFLDWQQPEKGDRILQAPVVLVPVELRRTSVRRRFRLAALDDDPVINPCLAKKLEEFGVEMPAAPDDWSEFSINVYLHALQDAVKKAGWTQKGWQVRPVMYLGFFSFMKYLMYLDMDPARWTQAAEGSRLVDHKLIRALCGDGEAMADAPQDFPDPCMFDQTQAPEQVFHVLDADSSQHRAVAAVRDGASLVIQGPPGTGKSQTITNIISECLAHGKTVLFVSQKMAALQVVQGRLAQVGLGDACLELHSTKANRKALLAELDRILTAHHNDPAPSVADAHRLSRTRAQLNQYVHDLHEPYGGADKAPYDMVGRVTQMKDIPDSSALLTDYEQWDDARWRQLRDMTGDLARQLAQVWPADEHPYRGATVTACTADIQRSVEDLLPKLTEAMQTLREATDTLAYRLKSPAPTTVAGVDRLLAAARCVAQAPADVESRLLTSCLWSDGASPAARVLEQVQDYANVSAWARSRYREDLLDTMKWEDVWRRYQTYAGSWMRWFRPGFWSDRSLVGQVRQAEHRPNMLEQTADLKRLADWQAARSKLDAAEEMGLQYFGGAWRGRDSDADQLTALAKWLTQYRQFVKEGVLDEAAAQIIAADDHRGGDYLRTVEDLDSRLARWRQLWGFYAGALKWDDEQGFAGPVDDTPMQGLAERLADMTRSQEKLHDWCMYQDHLQTCLGSEVKPFVVEAIHQRLEPDLMTLTLEKRLLTLLLEDCFEDRQTLRRFSAADHDATVDEFAELDTRWLEGAGGRLRRHMAAARPVTQFQAAVTSPLGILQGEIRRKRGGRPIRKLLQDAGEMVQMLKPCFMMSPLSVAQFLEPGKLNFDVVVFDEASQVEPADALGAVARSQQLVLVGDRRQLPPTSFFSALGGENVPERSGEAAGLTDMESILDQGDRALPSLRLRWHYRSRHESLIAFSNQSFYDGDLVVFPSSHAARDELGLSLIYNPEDSYDRGRSQTNRQQARRLAAFVFEHARAFPQKTLGVGAFSQRQQQAILDEIEKLRLEDDSLESFFSRDKAEPFFVKNLETIQGDERDVILLSIGYGRKEPGERLSMNFGPLNREGGQRRLNVLVTRARQRCIVFSSIIGEDFDLEATQARGVHLLKAYLDFANHGRLPGADRRKEFESPFEQAVYNALTDAGVTTHLQVGCEGYAIDMAVVDPDKPSRYLLGIECDGRAYRDAATARDRDRLRHSVLESLGWRVHRVWAPDWYRKPQSELQRLLDAIELAKAGRLRPRFFKPRAAQKPASGKRSQSQAGSSDQTAAAHSNIPALQELPPIDVVAYAFFTTPVVGDTEKFYTDAATTIADLIARVVRDEGPITQDEAIRRVADAYAISRVVERVRNRVEEAIQRAASAGAIVVKGDFLWPADMTTPPVRFREDDRARKIALICPEEIGRAACLLLAAQFGMSRQDLAAQVARVLGFASTSGIRDNIEAAIDQQIDLGRIACDREGFCRPAGDIAPQQATAASLQAQAASTAQSIDEESTADAPEPPDASVDEDAQPAPEEGASPPSLSDPPNGDASVDPRANAARPSTEPQADTAPQPASKE